jgi:hypothetical protein
MMNMNICYWRFAESERQVNQIQSGNRDLASGRMLAAFAAIALLPKTDQGVAWLLSPAVSVRVVSFIAMPVPFEPVGDKRQMLDCRRTQ